MTKLPAERFEALMKSMRLEKQFAEKIDVIGISFEQTKSPNTYSLKITNKRRPPTVLKNSKGNPSQGAHTFAYSGVLKGFVWSLQNVTLDHAKELLVRFHSWLKLKYYLCQKLKGYEKILPLKDLASGFLHDLVFEKNPSSALELASAYITTFIYLHNLFQDAAAGQDSTPGREREAFKSLEEIETLLDSKRDLGRKLEFYRSKGRQLERKSDADNLKALKLARLKIDWITMLQAGEGFDPLVKVIVMEELSSLIDQNAIQKIIEEEKTGIETSARWKKGQLAEESGKIGTFVVGFQITSIHTLLISLPRINRILFNGDLFAQNNKETVPILTRIIFLDQDPEHQEIVKSALAWIHGVQKIQTPSVDDGLHLLH